MFYVSSVKNLFITYLTLDILPNVTTEAKKRYFFSENYQFLKKIWMIVICFIKKLKTKFLKNFQNRIWAWAFLILFLKFRQISGSCLL